jgi:membrane protein YqaA with SNARE-associated domain
VELSSGIDTLRSEVHALAAKSPTATQGAAQGGHAAMPRWLVHLGGPGLFAVAILDSSPVPLPPPGSTDLLLLLLVSNRGNPFLLAGVAVIGSGIGGYLTWSAGKKGAEALLERSMPARFRKRLERWTKEHTILSVFFAAVLPPPIPLMPFLLAAGAFGASRNCFIISLVSARILRYSLIAWGAAIYRRVVILWWTKNLANWSSAILWTFIGLLVSGIVYGIWQYRRQNKSATYETFPH